MSNFISKNTQKEIIEALVLYSSTREAWVRNYGVYEDDDEEERERKSSEEQPKPFTYNGKSDLSEFDLSNLYLRHTNLRNAILNSANLKKCILTYALLEGAQLNKAKLNDARLEDARLNEADLSEANLTKAYLRGAVFIRANLSHATITHTSLNGVCLNEADLSFADLGNTNIIGAELTGAVLIGAKNIEPDDYANISYKYIKTPLELSLVLNERKLGDIILKDNQINYYHKIATRILKHYDITGNKADFKDGIKELHQAVNNLSSIEMLKPISFVLSNPENNEEKNSLMNFAANSIFEPELIGVVNIFLDLELKRRSNKAVHQK